MGVATSGPLPALSKGPAAAAEVSSRELFGSPIVLELLWPNGQPFVAQDQKVKQNLVQIVEGHLGP